MQLPRWDAAVARNQLEALSRLQSGRDFKEIISCLSLSLPFLLFIMFVVANSESWETVDHVDIAVRLIALVIPMAFCISSLSRWVGVSATMARAFGGHKSQKYYSTVSLYSKCTIALIFENFPAATTMANWADVSGWSLPRRPCWYSCSWSI